MGERGQVYKMGTALISWPMAKQIWALVACPLALVSSSVSMGLT